VSAHDRDPSGNRGRTEGRGRQSGPPAGRRPEGPTARDGGPHEVARAGPGGGLAGRRRRGAGTPRVVMREYVASETPGVYPPLSPPGSPRECAASRAIKSPRTRSLRKRTRRSIPETLSGCSPEGRLDTAGGAEAR
jgi:hypothetical protein